MKYSGQQGAAQYVNTFAQTLKRPLGRLDTVKLAWPLNIRRTLAAVI